MTPELQAIIDEGRALLSKATGAPWRQGAPHDSVVSDERLARTSDEAEARHYGGYLVAESMHSPDRAFITFARNRMGAMIRALEETSEDELASAELRIDAESAIAREAELRLRIEAAMEEVAGEDDIDLVESLIDEALDGVQLSDAANLIATRVDVLRTAEREAKKTLGIVAEVLGIRRIDGMADAEWAAVVIEQAVQVRKAASSPNAASEGQTHTQGTAGDGTGATENHGLAEAASGRDFTAYLVAVVDTSVSPPVVIGADVFSEPHPTLIGRHRRCVLIETATGGGFGEARASLLEAVNSGHPFYEWVRPLLAKGRRP